MSKIARVSGLSSTYEKKSVPNASEKAVCPVRSVTSNWFHACPISLPTSIAVGNAEAGAPLRNEAPRGVSPKVPSGCSTKTPNVVSARSVCCSDAVCVAVCSASSLAERAPSPIRSGMRKAAMLHSALDTRWPYSSRLIFRACATSGFFSPTSRCPLVGTGSLTTQR
jgi:hypothetical protein